LSADEVCSLASQKKSIKALNYARANGGRNKLPDSLVCSCHVKELVGPSEVCKTLDTIILILKLEHRMDSIYGSLCLVYTARILSTKLFVARMV
jgi:hypothetical protein